MSVRELENKEVMQVLRDRGYATLVDALCDPDHYCRNGRLNNAKVMRAMGWSTKRYSHAMKSMKELLTELGCE